MKHSCHAAEEDMEYVIRLTRVYGEEAKQKLHTFINEEQDGHWEYVTYDEYTNEHRRVRSKVVKNGATNCPKITGRTCVPHFHG